MKGDREVQLDNQPSPVRVLRGSRRNRTLNSSNMCETTTVTPHSPRRKSANDNHDNSIISTSPMSNSETSLDSGYSSQSANSGEQFLMDFNMQCPQVLMTSPVRRRRPSGNSVRSKHAKNQRYALNKRKSLPVIFEQDDGVFCSPTPPLSRKSQRHRIKRRPSSVSDAVIGASYSFPGVRRKGSTTLLDRNGLKKRISTLADGVVSGGATIVPVVPATGCNGSRQNSEVYSVIPRKTHLPRYGFIIQRNPYTPPPSNRRRLSTITISGYPHQVHVRRQQSTISIDEINKTLTQAKLDRKDSKVRFSVVEDAGATPSDARRDSIANKSDGTASQVAESVCTQSESESGSSSSGSDSSSSEWTTDSSDSSDSGSDSDSDTDSSYTTSSSSTSTSSDSSSDDSSSDGSSSDSDSSDEEDSSFATSRSISRSTFYTTDGSDATSISGSSTTDASSVAASSVATGVTDTPDKPESPSKTRTSSRSSNKSDKSKDSDKSERSSSSTSRSSSSASNQTAATESRRLSALSRSSTGSSFRSSSSSPIKSKKGSSLSRQSSRSSSLERPTSRTMNILSDVINSVSPKSSPLLKRRDSKRSKKSKTDENIEKHKSEKSERKKEKAERRKSNSHAPKENGDIILKTGSRNNSSMVSTPSVIIHKPPEKGTEMPPNNMSTTCVIL